MPTTDIKLRQQRVWLASHREIGYKIVNWHHSPEARMEDYWPSGSWNFYIYLPEKKCPDFAKIWLPDLEKEWSPGGRKYVTHAYWTEPLGSVEMHCDITFYEKHGHVEGHRCVELGCDYQHLYDEEQSYDEQDVARDAVAAIESAFALGILADPALSSRNPTMKTETIIQSTTSSAKEGT